MGLVQLADVIVPEVFDPYTSVVTTEKSALYNTGVIAPNASMAGKLSGGGRLFQTPFWRDLDNDEASVGTDDPEDEIVPGKITAGKHQFIRQFRTRAWSTADLTKELAGSDPAKEIAGKVGAYWGRQIDRYAIATIRGVAASNVANNSSDMVYDITAASGTVTNGAATVAAFRMHQGALYEARQTMGDNADALRMIIMHSRLHTNLLLQDQITFRPNSEGKLVIPTYCGHDVLVSDMCPVDVSGGDLIYTTYLCGPGVLGWAEKSPDKPVETERKPLKGNGAGVEILVHRKQFALHPGGFTFTDAATVDEFPNNAELANASNWLRVLPERKMIPLVVMKTKNG